VPREMTAGEFIAEELEREAAGMPSTCKTQADILRESAKHSREHGSKRRVRVWEEGEEGYPGKN